MNEICLTASQEAIIKHYLPDDKSIEKLSELFQVFSDKTRLKIMMGLCISEMCVGDIAEILNINQSTVSHQLKLLKNYNLIESKRVKKNIYYSVAGNHVEKLIDCAVDVNLSL